MRFEKVYIEGLGYHLPKNIITSAEIEERLAPLYERLKLPEGRLELMSGIKERRLWEKGVLPSEVATIAGEKAINQSNINKGQIGCLISASVCRDFLEPSTASVIHNKLQLPDESFVFDVSNACLGVLNGMMIIANMIEQDQILAGLVVAGENGGPLVNHTIKTLLSRQNITRSNIKSSFASLTIGSSAVGVVLVHEKLASRGHHLVGGVSLADTQFNHLCRGSDDSGAGADWSPLMETDSETLMQEGCRLAGKTWKRTREELDWKNENIAIPSFIGLKQIIDYPLEEIRKYIDWTFFFSAWEIRGSYPKLLNNPIGDNAMTRNPAMSDAALPTSANPQAPPTPINAA